MNRMGKLVGLSVAAMMLLSLIAPMLLVQPVSAADPSEWYKTVLGVLDTDYYTLYPFAPKLLKVGFSQFGELIDSNTNVGLEYAGDRDPFAPVAGITVPREIPKKSWINGWFISIYYNHSTLGLRNVWAGALFADINSYGGPWLRVDNNYTSCTHEWQEDFRRPGKEIDVTRPGEVIGPLRYGGRKTNGTVLTDPMEILYDGPRLFVAKITNHIYDWIEETKENLPLVDLVITLIFNKVKKEVIVIKDVKIVPPVKFERTTLKLEIPVDGTAPYQSVIVPGGVLVQLSNREEWDLGKSPTFKSYVHFYVAGENEGQDTVYDRDWTLVPTLPAGTTINTITVNRHGGEPADNAGKFDVAQIISDDKKYVGWHAFWPSVSDWSVTAGDDLTWYRALLKDDPHTTDGTGSSAVNTEPWMSPLIVGEWDFVLSTSRFESGGVVADVQFRGVSVYGITDLNDGSDEDMPGDSNKIDREVKYQLDEIFNPWDLRSAVHKETWRWVEFPEVKETLDKKYYVELEYSPERLGEWYEYCSFAERVLVDGQLITLMDALIWNGTKWSWWPSFPYTYNMTGGEIYFWKDKDGRRDTQDWEPWDVRGKVIKVLYSTYAPDAPVSAGRYEWVIVGRDAHTVDSAGAAMVTAAFKDKLLEYCYPIDYMAGSSLTVSSGGGAYIGLAGADMKETVVWNAMPWVMRRFGTGNTKADYKDRLGRAALKDDWCKTWPIASSNMIAVGGPLANMLAYYANDFTQAIFGLQEYAASMWDNKIIPLTCWDITKERVYASNEDVGYAVVATYKDINGTVLFLVWGHWGRDTYYACKWFHEEGIYQLQEAPWGTTAIILEIDYTVHEPSVSVVEVLGTISETLWEHNGEEKGGIHDP